MEFSSQSPSPPLLNDHLIAPSRPSYTSDPSPLSPFASSSISPIVHPPSDPSPPAPPLSPSPSATPPQTGGDLARADSVTVTLRPTRRATGSEIGSEGLASKKLGVDNPQSSVAPNDITNDNSTSNDDGFVDRTHGNHDDINEYNNGDFQRTQKSFVDRIPDPIYQWILMPPMVLLMIFYWLAAHLLAWILTFFVVPSYVLARKMAWACPFVSDIWSHWGPVRGTMMRLGFESSYSINVLTRLLTIPIRRTVPSFYIVGFPKCGTTSLAAHLKRHPALSATAGLPYHEALSKESHFFAGVLGREGCACGATDPLEDSIQNAVQTRLERTDENQHSVNNGVNNGVNNNVNNNNGATSNSSYDSSSTNPFNGCTATVTKPDGKDRDQKLTNDSGKGNRSSGYPKSTTSPLPRCQNPKGAKMYRSFFPTQITRWVREALLGVGRGKWTCFDACPVHACLPYVADRIHKIQPDAKIIIMVRDPTDGVFSAEIMLRDMGVQLPWSLAEPISDPEDSRIQVPKEISDLWDRMHLMKTSDPIPEEAPRSLYYSLGAQIQCGIYPPLVRKYYDLFGRQNVMVINFNDFVANTERVVKEVLDFVGASSDLFHFQRLPASMKNSYGNRKMHPSVTAALRRLFEPSIRELEDLVFQNNVDPEKTDLPGGTGKQQRRTFGWGEKRIKEVNDL